MSKKEPDAIDKQFDHLSLLLDIAQKKVSELRKIVKDPDFIRSATLTRKIALEEKLNEVLEGLRDLQTD
ncbi:MAG: hypothetical protein N2248_00360 [candidate division WOR-3 bacterium]|nr:hypothetical protein [candidate division WOR-3 bacterium]